MENIKKTAYNDPVGFLTDVASIFTAGGGLASKAGKIAGIEKLATTGAKASELGTALDPIARATRLRGGGRLEKFAESQYQSALKPTQAVLDKFPDVVKTGLREGIPVSGDGLDIVRDIMDDIDNQITDVIARGAGAGKGVDVTAVAEHLDRTRKFFENVPGSEGYLNRISKLEKELVGKADYKKGYTIPVDKAQEMKRATQQLLKKSYGKLSSANTEAAKDIARGLREEIAKVVPEVAKLNLRQVELIGLERALERFVGRYGNRNLIGLGTEVVGTGGAVVGGLKGGFIAGLVKAAIENPQIKSYVARLVYRVSRRVPTTRGLRRVTPALRAIEPERQQR